jgi:hypothetical protein
MVPKPFLSSVANRNTLLDFLEGEIKLVVSVAIFSGLELGGD